MKFKDFPSYKIRVLVSLSQLLNVVVFNGYPDEMLSSMAYRTNNNQLINIIDYIFYWQEDHCRQCYEWERKRIDSPRFNNELQKHNDNRKIN